MGQSSDYKNRLPVPVGPVVRHGRKVEAAKPAEAPYAAQILGQDGAKRGLKGGQPVLTAARAAYLEAEWSGPNDRRPAKGILKKTNI